MCEGPTVLSATPMWAQGKNRGMSESEPPVPAVPPVRAQGMRSLQRTPQHQLRKQPWVTLQHVGLGRELWLGAATTKGSDPNGGRLCEQ